MAVKQWATERQPRIAPLDRLVYSILALVLLVPPVGWTHRLRDDLIGVWDGVWGYAAQALLLMALAGFLGSLRYYGMKIFLGLQQWRQRRSNPGDPGPLCLSPLHRSVRHPWYSLGMLIVWTPDIDGVWLASALLITGYFLIGSRLEEQKLLIHYGEVYRRYQRRVPAFLPWFGRTLTRDEARALTALAMSESPREQIQDRSRFRPFPAHRADFYSKMSFVASAAASEPRPAGAGRSPPRGPIRTA